MSAVALPDRVADWAASMGATPARDVYAISAFDVTPDRWHESVASSAAQLGMRRLEFVTAIDEADGTFTIVAHLLGGAAVVGSEGLPLTSVFLRTRMAEGDVLESIVDVHPGAAWHQRELAEMFGITIAGSPQAPLLLTASSPEHPMRKSYWLAPRQDRPWPGAKEPGESDADTARDAGAGSPPQPPRRSRRRQRAMGVQPESDAR